MTTSNRGLGFARSLTFLLPLLLWILTSVVQAAPLAASAELAKRDNPPFPSLQVCKDKFTAPPQDKSLFFTGLSKKQINQVKRYAETHGLVHVGQSYPASFTDPNRYSGTEDERRAFQENFSRLYAEATSGTAYLMLDDGVVPKSSSIFMTVEFAAMKDRVKVDRILQFPLTNPPADPTKATKVFWPDPPADPPKL